MSATKNPPDPRKVWKGHAQVDREGVELALEMLDELRDNETDDEGVTTADYACLEDWPRRGHPFRNVVLEYLQRARQAGSEVEASFLAVLSDYISLASQGSARDIDRYAQVYGIE